MKIYLDNCALGRLTDDQSQPRVAAEAAAVRAVLDLFEAGVHQWVASHAVEIEVHSNPDEARRQSALSRLAGVTFMQQLSATVLARSRSLQRQGFGAMDALHLAAAIEAGCGVLLTTDARFISLARRTTAVPARLVLNPLDFSPTDG